MTDVAGTERSPLASFFEAAGGSREARYRAAMEAAVVFDRSHLGRIAVRGADGEAFLQNMLSADVKKLPLDAGTEATFLTNKGKIVSHLTVFKLTDCFVMEMESIRVAPLAQALSRYIISEDVTLDDRTSVETSFSVEGARAGTVLSELTGWPVDAFDDLEHLRTRGDDALRITARRRETSPRYDVTASAEKALALLAEAPGAGAEVGDSALAETRRIEAGRPRFGVDVDDSHMPLEAGLDEAISFDKGCYIGQEYVVRLAHRGHLNRKLVGIRIDTKEPPPPGSIVTAGGKEAGKLTSTAYSPTLSTVVALGYVRREHFAPDTEVMVAGELPGVVAKLPFI